MLLLLLMLNLIPGEVMPLLFPFMLDWHTIFLGSYLDSRLKVKDRIADPRRETTSTRNHRQATKKQVTSKPQKQLC
jgi:hypothetical protein